ncbi:MAG: hypothetical protein H0V89_03030 [Deltaproteobacteria bacterium]|nr:hypothetical protein [Deltaproteobacteria bacterium]
MQSIGWHITFDLRGRLPVARTAAEWDTATRTLGRVLAPWQNAAHCLVHDHAHGLVAGDREAAGRAAHAVECAIGWWRRSKEAEQRTTWNPPRFKPIFDRKNLADATVYVLENGGVATGTEALRWRWSSAWEVLGLREPTYALATGFEVTSVPFVAGILTGSASWRPPAAGKLVTPAEPIATLTRVAAVALGCPPAGDRMGTAKWRKVALALAVQRGWSPRDVAPALGISERSARRLAAEPGPNVALECASRLLGLVIGGLPLPELPPDPLPWGSRVRKTFRPTPPSPARPSP